MATRRKTVLEYQCDNPQCENVREGSADEPALGFHIKPKSVLWVHAGGGTITDERELYACKEACIVPALLAAML
jgi:hypothetical protein